VTATADGDTALDGKATEFADTLTELTRGVLGPDSPAFLARNLGGRVRVAPEASDGEVRRIPVRIDGEHCLSLYVQYLCHWDGWDGPERYLATEQADVHVFLEGVQEPLLRYEYVRDCQNPPGAHIQMHAHRDEMAYLLRLAERKDGRPAKALRRRRPPRISEMHLPVGGHRLRPALEDVLLFMEREWAIDVEPGWRPLLERHLRDWRRTQLRAAVRDAHEDAAETLRKLGYEVTATERVRPQTHDSRLYWP
jgi:hypothetical protein